MTLGIHPYHASELYAEPEAWATLVSLANTLPTRDGSCVVAFGEIGLDYFYLNKASKEDQQRAFKEQLELATTLDLPLFLHIRDSHQDFVEIIKPYLPRLPRRGVVHSFTGNADQMQELVDLGFDISVCGISFTTAEQLEMVKEIPLDRLHLESDAPWCEIPSTPQINGLLQSAPSLPPSQKPKNYVSGHMVQGRNESCTINRVALVVAGIKDLALDTVANAAWQNSLRMFKLHDTVDN
ncbi:hypothetical protein B0A52_05933 [Exophiala mesophila]|uniref:Uncharacterized protein n=1 Tax=Exophiala mesophila TaxID=212818 RepID=A0A438N3X4_EXOME|nr:hypothetical protein B0A52_05933 [Exophiala mesophila]